MMQKPSRLPIPLRFLAEAVKGEVTGEAEVLITGVGEVESAQDGDLVFAWTKRSAERAFASPAAAVVVTREFARPEKPCLIVNNPRWAMAVILENLFPPEPMPAHVSPQATVEDDVQLGEQVSVGAFAFIGKGSVIGDGTIVFPHAFIGRNVRIGSQCLIHPFATLYEGVILGNRVVVHSGAVIGKEGFGFVWDGHRHLRIPQIGTVVIEDDVEIGAHVCVDRATLGETRIRRGTKIDNLVQIAHNCTLGENCVLAGQVGLAGSVTVGNNVIMGGQVGIADHVHIGDEAILLGKAGLMSDVPPKTQWAGYPARPRTEWLRIEAALSKLPEALRSLRQLVKRLEAMEKVMRKRNA